MDWTVEDYMVDDLFCATLTGRRGGLTSFVQTWAESPDAGAEVVNPPRLFLGGSLRDDAGAGDENA